MSDEIKINGLDKRLEILSIRWWIYLGLLTVLVFASMIWASNIFLPTVYRQKGIYVATEGLSFVVSSQEGVVTEAPKLGKIISQGEVAARVFSEGKEFAFQSLKQGKVIESFKEPGDWVDKGDRIAALQPSQGDFRVIGFVPIEHAGSLQIAMPTRIEFSNEGLAFEGQIAYISPYVASKGRLFDLLGNENLIDFLTSNKPVVEVHVVAKKRIHQQLINHLASLIFTTSNHRLIQYVFPVKEGKNLLGS